MNLLKRRSSFKVYTAAKRLLGSAIPRKPGAGSIPKSSPFLLLHSGNFLECCAKFKPLKVFSRFLGALTGGVDEEMFMKSFEDVPKVQFFSVKEFEDHLVLIRNTIQDPNNDWSKRTEAVS